MPLETISEACKNGQNFIWMKEWMCIVSYDSADDQKQDENNGWRWNKYKQLVKQKSTEHGEVNLQMKTHAYVRLPNRS